MAGKSNSRLRVNSFFAGIGGFDLGFQRAGIRPNFHCEIQPYCASVLQRHWPKTKFVPDILHVKSEDIPEAEVWCGGFPCQDVSVARGWLGRDGLKGKNTGLFYPFAELVRSKLPEVVLLENVTGLLSSHDGRDFAVILKSFQDMGYGVAWRILNARYFGVPQSRPRVYVCAWRGSTPKAFNALFEKGTTVHPGHPRHGFLKSTVSQSTGAIVPEVAFCLAATSGRHTGTDWSRTYVAYQDKVRRLTPTECERLQGFPESWTLPSPEFHLSDEEIDTLRYHAIGNAVAVPVVEWVAKKIRSELKLKTALTDEHLKPAFVLEYVRERVPDFNHKKAKLFNISDLMNRDAAPKIKWSSGGVMVEGQCLMTAVSSAPNKIILSKLVDALDGTFPPSQYFLSPNAATGILRRVASQGRELFAPLDAALRRLSNSSAKHASKKETIEAN